MKKFLEFCLVACVSWYGITTGCPAFGQNELSEQDIEYLAQKEVVVGNIDKLMLLKDNYMKDGFVTQKENDNFNKRYEFVKESIDTFYKKWCVEYEKIEYDEMLLNVNEAKTRINRRAERDTDEFIEADYDKIMELVGRAKNRAMKDVGNADKFNKNAKEMTKGTTIPSVELSTKDLDKLREIVNKKTKSLNGNLTTKEKRDVVLECKKYLEQTNKLTRRAKGDAERVLIKQAEIMTAHFISLKKEYDDCYDPELCKILRDRFLDEYIKVHSCNREEALKAFNRL